MDSTYLHILSSGLEYELAADVRPPEQSLNILLATTMRSTLCKQHCLCAGCQIGARLVHLGPLDLVEHKASQYFKEVKITSVMTSTEAMT